MTSRLGCSRGDGRSGADRDRTFRGAGGDRVRYEIELNGAAGPFSLQVELLYQSVGYRWVENLRGYDEAEEVARFIVARLRGVVCTPIQSAGSVDNRRYWGKITVVAEVAKQADALRSGRSGSIPMWVQIPPSALLFKHIAWSFGRAIFFLSWEGR